MSRKTKDLIWLAGVLIIGTYWLVKRNQPTPTLLSPLVSAEPSPAVVLGAIDPSPELTASPSASPKASSSPKPSPSPLPSPTASEKVNEYIEKYAAQYAVDPNVLRHVAVCESGFNSSAVNGIYVGLFQFDAAAWKNIRQEMGKAINSELRFSAEESAQTAAFALSKDRGKLWPNCYP